MSQKSNFTLLLFIVFNFTITAQSIFTSPQVIVEQIMSSSSSGQIEMADMNNDGLLDIVFPAGSSLGWYPNNGMGGYHPVVKIEDMYSGSGGCGWISISDVDNDGDLDVIAASTYEYVHVFWFKNDGTGTFGKRIPIFTGEDSFTTPSSIASADMDNDGDEDLLLAMTYPNLSSGKFYALENDGNGNFSTTHIINTVFYTGVITAGDVNGDGVLDVIASTYAKTVWYENLGNWNFGQNIIIDWEPSNDIKHDDLDGDGDLDIVCALGDADRIAWYENDGTGDFAAGIYLTNFFSRPSSVDLADTDNDGDLDVIAAARDEKRVIEIKNNGNGNFGSEMTLTDDFNEDSYKVVASNDIDGDGFKDVVISGDGKTAWLQNMGNGSYSSEQVAISRDILSPNATYTADLDNDGDLDVLSSSSGDDKIAWYENLGNGSFSDQNVISVQCSYATNVRAADLDGDGFVDIIATCSNLYNNSHYGQIIWYQNDGNGNFLMEQKLTDVTGVSSFELSDIDADGDMDIIAGLGVIWYNNGTGLFTFEDVGISSGKVIIADMTGNGKEDIVVASGYDVTWHRNWANSYFGTYENPIAGGFQVRSTHVADLDNDGDNDVLIMTNSSPYFRFYENLGEGSFGGYTALDFDNSLYSFNGDISTTDLDNDGDEDIILAYGRHIFYFQNKGDGTFETGELIIGDTDYHGPIYSFVHPADLDGDGLLDFLSVNANFSYNNSIAWYKNIFSSLVYVDENAQGSNNGSSWADAFTDLQDALALGNGKTIYLAEGTYLPIQNGSRSTSFDIPSGTTILGGFPTGGGARDPKQHITILSGNIDNIPDYGGNSFHVVTLKNVNDVQLDGFSIKEGNANDPTSFARARGGGVYMKNSTAVFNNVDIRWNKAIYGGGLFATEFSDITITNALLKNNTASENGSAIYYSQGSSLEMTHSKITNNNALNRCAIEANNASSTEIRNSLIAANPSTNANAISFIATTRNQTGNIINSTIIGDANDKNLITLQVGNNDQLDLNINNSIVAHKFPSFSKNIVSYNYGTLNFNHSHCYFQGSSVIGTGNNNLFSDIDGDLMLNADYTVNECSPVVDAGDSSCSLDETDLLGDHRYRSLSIDMGAYEATMLCTLPREAQKRQEKFNITLFPNPTKNQIQIKLENFSSDYTFMVFDALGRKINSYDNNNTRINTSNWQKGIYFMVFYNDKGEIIGNEKVIKID